MKRLCCLVWICTCFQTMNVHDEPVRVSFDAQSRDYNENLEIYLSNSNSYYCFKLGPDNEYDLSQEVAEGDYTIHAFSTGDANHYYDYVTAPEKLTVRKGENGRQYR